MQSDPQAEPPERLTRLPSWLLAQAAAHAHRLVTDELAAAGLRRLHFSVLLALREGGPASQADLGRRLATDRSDMHAVLALLEEKGLVDRAREPTDRRRNVTGLTPRGRATLKRLDARVERAQATLLAPLEPAERDELVRLLTRLLP